MSVIEKWVNNVLNAWSIKRKCYLWPFSLVTLRNIGTGYRFLRWCYFIANMLKYMEMTRSLYPCWLFVPSSRSFENSSVLPIIVTEEILTGSQACKAIYSWRKFNTGGVDLSRAQTQSDSWNIMQIMIRVCLICSKTNPDERHLRRNVTQESGFFQLDGHKEGQLTVFFFRSQGIRHPEHKLSDRRLNNFWP